MLDTYLFLTFDIDWANDDVIDFTLDIINEYQLPATFFATHQSGSIQKIAQNPIHEIGIHPNFIPLLNQNGALPFTQVIDQHLEWFPNAVSSRSHGLVTSSGITKHLAECQLRYDSNQFLFPENAPLVPYRHYSGLIEVPYFYEDDIYAAQKAPRLSAAGHLDLPGPKVFDFHPIHVFLNTETLERYEVARPDFKNISKLKAHVNTETAGTRDFLRELIENALRRNMTFACIRDLQSLLPALA